MRHSPRPCCRTGPVPTRNTPRRVDIWPLPLQRALSPPLPNSRSFYCKGVGYRGVVDATNQEARPSSQRRWRSSCRSHSCSRCFTRSRYACSFRSLARFRACSNQSPCRETFSIRVNCRRYGCCCCCCRRRCDSCGFCRRIRACCIRCHSCIHPCCRVRCESQQEGIEQESSRRIIAKRWCFCPCPRARCRPSHRCHCQFRRRIVRCVSCCRHLRRRLGCCGRSNTTNRCSWPYVQARRCAPAVQGVHSQSLPTWQTQIQVQRLWWSRYLRAPKAEDSLHRVWWNCHLRAWKAKVRLQGLRGKECLRACQT